MSENTRQTLLGKKNAFNQIRNIVYWLERFMKQSNIPTTEISDRLLRMGKNMGATFAKEYVPKAKKINDLIVELYQVTTHSKVKVTRDGHTVTVENNKCCHCKYNLKDIDVAGCTIEMGTVGEILERNGYRIKSMVVTKSKTFGDEICSHKYWIFKEGM